LTGKTDISSGPRTTNKTLILACGALAKEIVFLKNRLGAAGEAIDLQCLPADYHNRPGKIVPGLKAVMDERGKDYDTMLIGYGDCGTGGLLDGFIRQYDNVHRLPGAHCYEFFAGTPLFEATMEEELGTFFLTDYLARHFDRIIIKGMGLDRYPDLYDSYFGNYKKLVYFSQIEDEALIAMAREAAEKLNLEFVYRHVGYGALEPAISALTEKSKEPEHAA